MSEHPERETIEPIKRPNTTIRTHLRACAAAFTFLTRIPAHRLVSHDTSDLSRASLYFPLVGCIVGLAGGIAYAAGTYLWPTALSVVLSVAVTVWMTGAFHEDALADALDGFGGGWGQAHILAIMKDSRIGSSALIGVILVLAAKLEALTIIATAGATTDILTAAAAVTKALIAAHVLGRWSSLPLIWRQPYVRPDTPGERPSAGRPFVAGVTRGNVVLTSVASLMIVVAVLRGQALPVLIVAVLGTAIADRYFAKHLGGITGDALGAANQLIELSVYLALAARHVGT